MSRRLGAAQAADRLGVKVETLYAYVSRGLIVSERAADGRSSTFDRRDVERLAARGRPRRSSRGPTVDVSIRTGLTDIDGRRLRYRGRDAVELSGSASFEQVAELLWSGDLPGRPPRWPAGRHLGSVPDGGALVDVLRAVVAIDACSARVEPDITHAGTGVLLGQGPGVIATMVDALPVRATGGVPRLVLGSGAQPRSEELLPASIASRLAVRLVPRRPTSVLIGILNAALVLLADHEMAASTFAARLAASVRADAHAVVSSGLGPLAGAYHGRASTHVRDLFDAAARTSPVAAVARLEQAGGVVPGFGHPLYPHGDPRAVELLRLLDAATASDAVRRVGAPVRQVRLVREVLDAVSSSDLGRPNVDFALGAVGHLWSMPPDAGAAVFAVARCAGWLAHAAEEWGRQPVRFRARALYTGP